MFFERPETGERAILVHVHYDPVGRDRAETDSHDDAEFTELARAAGAEIVGALQTRRFEPTARLFLRAGKAEELEALVRDTDAELVIFDHDLSPAQERNLEQLLKARVLSRTGLILDIFAQRARTHEGKLQVELAQLEHMSTRLVRGWTHLDRQKGGIGLRGAGETQLELDQRMLRGRIASVERRLGAVQQRRAQSRRSRQRARVPLVAFVGYTNSGKSTLFNALAHAGVFAADQLFATLDPTLRRIEVSGYGGVVIADTVGFVRRLPHRLVDAFKATLEEVAEADLLVHVLDAADASMEDKREQVHEVLAEIDAMRVPRIEVHNKIDLTEDPVPVRLTGHGRVPAVRLSARDGTGLDLLDEALACALGGAVRVAAVLAPAQGRMRADFYAHGWVEHEYSDAQGNLHLDLHLPVENARHLQDAGVVTAAPEAVAGALVAAPGGGS
ncbi:MAG: ribosome rescue GTPase HflX [Pseudomonadales bacterium]|nr:ribosome rescue GTPase HflX [Pseudomonadales bacterium]